MPPVAPAPAPVPPPAPAPAKGKGCSIGCLVVLLIVGLLVAAAAFFGWRYYQAQVAPWVDAFSEASISLPTSVCVDLEGTADTATGWNEVACDEPHDAELYWAETIEGDTHPGSERIAARADSTCSEAFASFVGETTAGYTYQAAVPSEASWTNGDRDLICMVITTDGSPSTGSAAGD